MNPYPLPNINTEKQIVIYGTGEIGKQYFQQIVKMFGDEKIAFFLDSNPNRMKIFNKPIKKVNLINREEINNYIYLIASVKGQNEIKESLINERVFVENIILPIEPFHKNFLINLKFVERYIFFPRINNEHELIKLVEKISWYLPATKESNRKVNIYVDENINISKSLKEKMKILEIQIKTDQSYEINENAAILVWNQYALNDAVINEYRDRVFCIDENYYSTIESTNLSLLYIHSLTYEQKQLQILNSKANFKKMIEESKKFSKSFIFGTGPSVDDYYKYDFSNSFTVICNSIVKNDQMLSHIQPKLIVFADPVFHMGHSEYANQFRKHVVEAVTKYECYCILPEEVAPLFSYHYPEIKNRLIGIPRIQSNEYNFPSMENFWVKSAANIATIFMLPISSILTDEIFILGIDGREPGETYFWKHSSNAQYDDMMDTVFKAHPSFFRDRVYEEYYEEHCIILEKLINFGESLGKRYYSLTPSHIQCLKDRRYLNE